MDTASALITRKSVRAFLNKSVSKALIEKILDKARHAPSGKNSQPWNVSVVTGRTKQILDKKLEEAFWNKHERKMEYNYYPQQMPPEFKAKAIECGMLLYETLNIKRDDTETRLKQWAKNYSAFGAPTTLYFFVHNLADKGSFLDYGLFLQSVMLMATSLGLATCPQAALAEFPDIVKSELGYSTNYTLVCGLAIGYEDTKAPINNYRTPRDEVAQFTKFFD